jgi:hypothetical protein
MGREWGGEVSSRATWAQGGRDRTTQKEGFQVSKREWKGNRQGNGQGVQIRGIAPQPYMSIYVRVYNNRVNATINLMCLGYK